MFTQSMYFRGVIQNEVKDLSNVSWWKGLLGETKVSFVATDANAPRRPCAGSFTLFRMTEISGQTAILSPK